jgi:hypothetical protein
MVVLVVAILEVLVTEVALVVAVALVEMQYM